MSEEVKPRAPAGDIYMVKRFGGVDMPDIPALQKWLNQVSAAGWALQTVDNGVGYFYAPSGTPMPKDEE